MSGAKASKFFLWFGCGWLILGLPFIFVGNYLLKNDTRFNQEALTITGTVVSKRVEEQWDSKKRHKERRYYVDYRFKPKNARELEGSQSIGSEQFEALNTSSPIEIEYLPQEPEKNRLKGTDEMTPAYVFLGLGALTTLVGIASIRHYLKRKSIVRRLMREGMLTDAVIEAIRPGNLKINGVPQYRIHYSFKDLMGKSVSSTSGHMSPHAATLWKVGDTGKVRFNRNKPEEHVWLGNEAAHSV